MKTKPINFSKQANKKVKIQTHPLVRNARIVHSKRSNPQASSKLSKKKQKKVLRQLKYSMKSKGATKREIENKILEVVNYDPNDEEDEEWEDCSGSEADEMEMEHDMEQDEDTEAQTTSGKDDPKMDDDQDPPMNRKMRRKCKFRPRSMNKK